MGKVGGLLEGRVIVNMTRRCRDDVIVHHLVHHEKAHNEGHLLEAQT